MSNRETRGLGRARSVIYGRAMVRAQDGTRRPVMGAIFARVALATIILAIFFAVNSKYGIPLLGILGVALYAGRPRDRGHD